MKKIIVTGASSALGQKFLSLKNLNNKLFFCQINSTKNIIKKKNINYYKVNFLNDKSVNSFNKKLITANNKYDAILHFPSDKLILKRFFEYSWNDLIRQLKIQFKSLHIILSALKKNNKINDNFKIVLISSYITKKKKYVKGLTSYFLAKKILESYAEVIKEELIVENLKVLILKPQIFKSRIYTNLPKFFLQKNLRNNVANELDKVVKKIAIFLGK